MKTLNKNELKQIKGGGFNFGFMVALGAGITFFIGLVDGYLRPLACH